MQGISEPARVRFERRRHAAEQARCSGSRIRLYSLEAGLYERITRRARAAECLDRAPVLGEEPGLGWAIIDGPSVVEIPGFASHTRKLPDECMLASATKTRIFANPAYCLHEFAKIRVSR